MPLKINSFRGQYFFLSNFYPTPITYEGIEYPSSEHAYQAAKTLDTGIRQAIALLKTPGESKRAGRNVVVKENWDKIKTKIMFDILQIKFQKASLRQWLLNTNNAILVEGNYWHDNFWGVCNCRRCNPIQKQNVLGQLLTTVRENIRKEIYPCPSS